MGSQRVGHNWATFTHSLPTFGKKLSIPILIRKEVSEWEGFYLVRSIFCPYDYSSVICQNKDLVLPKKAVKLYQYKMNNYNNQH